MVDKLFHRLLVVAAGFHAIHYTAAFSQPRLPTISSSELRIRGHVPSVRLACQAGRRNLHLVMQEQQDRSKPLVKKADNMKMASVISAQLIAGAFAWGLNADLANAKDGAFGVLETSWAGMLHPAGMLFLYGLTVTAGYHGWQWRRIRSLGQEISVLQKAGSAESQVKELQQTRSSLLSAGHKDQHVAMASLILAAGVSLAVEGCFSTWWRVGELFPGEHIFAGAGTVLCWVLAASLSPWMTKGNDAARNAHIALNVLGFLLFTWQIASGLEITINVFNRVPGW